MPKLYNRIISPLRVDFLSIGGKIIGGVCGKTTWSPGRLGVTEINTYRVFFDREDPRGLRLICRAIAGKSERRWAAKIMRRPLSCSPSVPCADGKTWLFEVVGMIGKEIK